MNSKLDRAAWLKGGETRCNILPLKQSHPLRLVLLGPPGIGKGTQAELLTQRFGTCQLSTGDVFRTARKLDRCECSPAMLQALERMDAGDLVTDETVLSLVKERAKCLSCGGGFLLDGFPRTVAQAEALAILLKEQHVELDAVVSYDLPLDQIVARLSGRRTCSSCKKIYHTEARPPRQKGICDDCGTVLFQRADDRPDAICVRMDAYQKSTLPLIEFYRRAGLLITIMADETPEKIFTKTLTILGVCCPLSDQPVSKAR